MVGSLLHLRSIEELSFSDAAEDQAVHARPRIDKVVNPGSPTSGETVSWTLTTRPSRLSFAPWHAPGWNRTVTRLRPDRALTRTTRGLRRAGSGNASWPRPASPESPGRRSSAGVGSDRSSR